MDFRPVSTGDITVNQIRWAALINILSPGCRSSGLSFNQTNLSIFFNRTANFANSVRGKFASCMRTRCMTNFLTLENQTNPTQKTME
jgi:hypothetical protein